MWSTKNLVLVGLASVAGWWAAGEAVQRSLIPDELLPRFAVNLGVTLAVAKLIGARV